MKATRSDRGFEFLTHPAYLEPCEDKRLVSQSSAIGQYPDSYDRPGTSFLWVGEHHHLDRAEVRQLIEHLQRWLDTGRLGEGG